MSDSPAAFLPPIRYFSTTPYLMARRVNITEKRREDTAIFFDVKSDKTPVGHLVEVIIDAEDWPLVSALNWREDRNGYIVAKTRNIPRRTILLHRLIMSFPASHIDHINMDKADNRKENLRPTTHSQNHANKVQRGAKRFKGVYYHGPTRRYQASVTCQGKTHSLGYHDTEEEAARAYDEAAKRLFGEFARLNFPDLK